MGWAMLLLAALVAAALLWALKLPRALWTFAGAALMLGAAGYALQGRPALGGAPATPDARSIAIDPELVELREAMLGRFTGEAAYFTASDAMLRSGDTGAAVAVMQGAVRAYPRNQAFWTGLGTDLSLHNGGLMAPASKFAFEQAMRLAPRHSAPPFFMGLALANSGDFAQARPLWARALALTPPGSSYRNALAERLALLDQYLASQEPGPGAAERAETQASVPAR